MRKDLELFFYLFFNVFMIYYDSILYGVFFYIIFIFRIWMDFDVY